MAPFGRWTEVALARQWNHNQTSFLSHPLFQNVFVLVNVWFQLQDDRKTLVECRLFVTSKFNPISFDFFFFWPGKWCWVSTVMPARKIFLSFQNPLIKYRTLFASVLFPNNFLHWKKKITEELPGRRPCLYCKAPEMAEHHGQSRAARFLCAWEKAALIVSDFCSGCCLLKQRD